MVINATIDILYMIICIRPMYLPGGMTITRLQSTYVFSQEEDSNPTIISLFDLLAGIMVAVVTNDKVIEAKGRMH